MKLASHARFVALNVLLPLGLSWALIYGIEDRYYGTPSTWSRNYSSYGALTLKLQLPGTASGIEEPLLSVGRIGNATFVYIRLLKGSRAAVGVEFWGYGAWESPPFKIPAQDAQITIVTSFPALFPKRGSRDWGDISDVEQKHLMSSYVVAVDRVVRIKGAVNYEEPPRLPIYLGRNPLGGSAVSDVFTGKIIAAWHEY